MHINIVKIGNSQGIRIPLSMLKECGFGSEADIQVDHGKIILSPKKTSIREGWEKAFKKAVAKAPAEKTIFPQINDHTFDDEEWTWDDESF